MKHIYLSFILIIFFTNVKAQQEAMFTHYMYNTQAVNPAYSGSLNALSVTALNRNQWVGFDGAPVTQTISINAPIVSKNIGLGFSFLNDKIGFVNKTYMFADFAYKIQLNKTSWLSFGLKGGVNYRRVNFTGMELNVPDDPDFSVDALSKWLPNVGAGIYYFTDQYYLGLSVPKIMENDFEIDANTSVDDIAGEQKHYFFIAGYLFEINELWKIKPTTYVKVTKSAPIQLDLTAQVIYNDKFWFGSMFRAGDAAGAMVGMFITPQLSFGYSYDWSFANRTFKYNGGSHEIVLRYDAIFSNSKEIISPRYF